MIEEIKLKKYKIVNNAERQTPNVKRQTQKQ